MKYSNKESIAIKFYRIENWCYEHKLEILANLIYHIMQILFGCTIPYSAILGKDVNIAHFHRIVVHHKSIGGYGIISKLLFRRKKW